MLDSCLDKMMNDHRITVWNGSLYVVLLHLWMANSFQCPFSISRQIVMKRAHIGSIVTYHKCIRELQQYNYIVYVPSYHPHEGSKITIIFDEQPSITNNQRFPHKRSTVLS